MKIEKKKNIVVSAVNLNCGGTLSILKDCLEYLTSELRNSYNIIALVHDRSLSDIDGINYYEFPLAKKCWGIRLYYEYVYFKKLSKKIKPHLWLSLHDITANVDAEIQAVYCHNPSPFHELTVKEAWFEPKFALFNKFYLYLYKLKIRKNDFVIVQQKWLREQFKSFFPTCNIIVAHPEIKLPSRPIYSDKKELSSKTVFFFPSFPRVFKNFEVICKAAKKLDKMGVKDFIVLMTINGSENRYSKYIFKKYQHLKPLRFIGLQSCEDIYKYYNQTDCMIFPSKLETWGLPITEFKSFNKPILLSNSRYSLETLDGYSKARLFDHDNSFELSQLMKDVIEGTIEYHQLEKVENDQPFAQNWCELFEILLKEKNGQL